jgi:hypothetical protein
MNAPRYAAVLGVVAAYAAVVMGAENATSMAVGIVPIAWIGLEAAWCLFAPPH